MASTRSITALHGRIVEDDVELTMVELCHACRVSADDVETWVVEGVLQPIGATRDEWRFAGASLARMRTAMRLARDLEVNTPGIALAIDLLDRIARLEARLRQVGVAMGQTSSSSGS